MISKIIMTQPREFGNFDNRSLFDVFHQPEIDADDTQSDIFIDLDIEEGLISDVGPDLDLETGSDDDDHASPAPGPSRSRFNDNNGWITDCSGLGENVLPFTAHTGPVNNLPVDALPIDYFHQLIPLSFFEKLAEETNLDARQSRRKGDTHCSAHPFI